VYCFSFLCTSDPKSDGAANKDVTDRYAEQLKEDVQWRKEVAESAGLGLELPNVESSVGLLGLPKQQKIAVEESRLTD
jgi:hypothetical protein